MTATWDDREDNETKVSTPGSQGAAAGNFEADGEPRGYGSKENDANASEREAAMKFECSLSPDAPGHVGSVRGWAKLSPSEIVWSLFPSCLAFRGNGERKYKHRVSSSTVAVCVDNLSCGNRTIIFQKSTQSVKIFLTNPGVIREIESLENSQVVPQNLEKVKEMMERINSFNQHPEIIESLPNAPVAQSAYRLESYISQGQTRGARHGSS
ncbi:hypothetical protein GQ600_10943 [Phytophthora cactorum]|nr:hypothetical protein GQ600_10943 [Phytophthora cactorum]